MPTDAELRVVDMLWAVATDATKTRAERDAARAKLRACAHRQLGETVHDVVRPTLASQK